MAQARFITFEGGEGSGKSTQIALLASALRELGETVLTVREPGSSVVGESIRATLLDPANAAMSDRAELLLYEAARAQVVDEVIRPALEAGTVVLADRYFDSTTAYQGYGRGLNLDEIAQLNAFAVGGLVPDRTVVLDIPADEGLTRALSIGQPDRLEQQALAFHERVREGFLDIALTEPNRVRVVDAVQNVDAVFADVLFAVEDLFPALDVPLDGVLG